MSPGQEPPMKRIVLLIVAGLLLAAPTAAAEYYTKFKKDTRKAEPKDGHAIVYVMRPTIAAYAIKTWAFVDKDLIMVSKPNAYAYIHVPEGKHMFWTKSENTSALEMDVVAGETYYLKIVIKAGLNKARAKIVEVTEQKKIDKMWKQVSYVEPTPEGLARAEEIVANRFDRAVNKAEERKEKDARKAAKKADK